MNTYIIEMKRMSAGFQHIRICVLVFFLTGLLQVTASCHKADSNSMMVTTIDSTAITPVGNDTTQRNYLALGDSYTIATSISTDKCYTAQTIGLLKTDDGIHFHDPLIIATNGWTTINLMNALDNRSTPLPANYDIVTLLIGVNDQFQGGTLADYKTNFTILLKKAIVFAGNRPSHVVVLSIPDYSVTPFGKASPNYAVTAAELDSFNAMNRQLSSSFGVNYLNVTDESRKAASDPSLLASDNLHYSAKEYAIWAGMLAPLVRKILP